jgi:hypothetical protein
MSRSVGTRSKLQLALVALTILAAPTVGDIGSCGQAITDLDSLKFFAEKDFVDCTRCGECGLTSEACVRACDVALTQTEFPEGCFPLVHDGEVCLNALRAASCAEYRGFTDDNAATIPTECNFCPVTQAPSSGGGMSGQGGQGGAT